MIGATITGTILGGILGIVAWWVRSELGWADFWNLIGHVIILGAICGYIAYYLWQRYFL
ncbi:MAG: hypothetical protein OXD46_06850 [Chloroflexi bacterium]|nr:hypothetical protein [Chloroflexota bacterium]